MPLQATSGAASYDAFGGGVPVVPNYIEDVFSTYLYIGTGATQTITNGIDLSGKGGLVWTKARSSVSGAPTYYTHELTDTVRGANNGLTTSTTAPQSSSDVNGFTSTGFNLTYSTGRGNAYDINEVSWTFRKQPKFFDVVTWTGDSTPRTIAHNLGSVPGCIMVKCTSMATDWNVYHQSLGNTFRVNLNQTSAAVDIGDACWNATTPTSTVFSLGTNSGVNSSGSTYVAYLFAHNAGGFGLTGTDNVISCGSFTLTGGEDIIDLGYEPQWLLTKRVNAALNWELTDNMRGMTVSNSAAYLYPNNSNAETSGGFGLKPTATGISITAGSTGSPGDTFIYIAIRRGPMKVPTSGTSVFSPSYGLSASNSEFVNAGFPIDLNWRGRTTGDNNILQDRLRGASQLAFGNLTSAESTSSAFIFTTQNGCTFTSTADFSTWVNWSFRRAPSFFDEVCYTGTGGSTLALTHNLGVQPELIITKSRSGVSNWYTLITAQSKIIPLNGTSSSFSAGIENVYGNGTIYVAPTSTQYTVGTNFNTANTWVSYLFATCAGVSKVFNYTGNGSSQTINCGFTGGARFVLIKRTDSTGDWYVWDSARGIVSGNDPHLSLNTTAAEVTTDDTIDTDSTGFVVNQVSATNVNVSSATYIGIAIA